MDYTPEYKNWLYNLQPQDFVNIYQYHYNKQGEVELGKRVGRGYVLAISNRYIQVQVGKATQLFEVMTGKSKGGNFILRS